MKSLELAYEAERPPNLLLPEIIADLSRGLAMNNYKLQNVFESQGERILTFTRSYRPWFVWLFGIVLFPLLFTSTTAVLTFVLEPTARDGTRIRVTGEVDRYARRSLEGMKF